MSSSTMTALLFAVLATAVAAGPLGTYGMPPCKHCGSSKLHSRDDLLAMDDGTLKKMENDIGKEIEDLQKDVDDLKEKNGAELGKLDKRLQDMEAGYKKFGNDAVARTAKFTSAKAKASKDFDSSLDSTLQAHNEIAKMHTSMDTMRKYLNPYVDKMISGKGWPHGCKCAKAKALLQRLEASLQLASIDVSDESPVPKSALLRKSAKTVKPADQEKYKLARIVSTLEEKRAKLMQEKTQEISGYGQKQRSTLDRIDVAKAKTNLKIAAEHTYKDNDKGLEDNLKAQQDAADSWGDNAKTELARLKQNEKASKELFASFKAELTKCKCL